MLNLKKTAVAVLAFGSSAVFAGTMGPVCAPGNVTVPCANTAWDFGAQALYLEPSLSGYAYDGVTISDNTATYNQRPKDWAWGFQIEGSYHFSTGNDLNLNWYHLNHTSNNTNAFVAAVDVESPFGGADIITAGDAITNFGTSKPTWDAVNLEFGQHAHFGEWKNIRFHGGVQYAHIELNQSNVITDTPFIVLPQAFGTPFVIGATADSKYNGFGPRIGADYWYNWGNGFAMYANGASSLLVGSQSFNDTLAIGALTPFTITGSSTAIVPQVEAKLGATYTYAMAQGDLSLNVGWMWVNYFNALSNISVAALDVGASSVSQTNFAVQGPFIGLKWIGNVA